MNEPSRPRPVLGSNLQHPSTMCRVQGPTPTFVSTTSMNTATRLVNLLKDQNGSDQKMILLCRETMKTMPEPTSSKTITVPFASPTEHEDTPKPSHQKLSDEIIEEE